MCDEEDVGRSSFAGKLLRLNKRLILLSFSTMSDRISLHFGQSCCFLVGHPFAPMVFDLEHKVDFFQGQTLGFNVEEPDNRKPSKVQDSEDDIESPFNVGDGYKIGKFTII